MISPQQVPDVPKDLIDFMFPLVFSGCTPPFILEQAYHYALAYLEQSDHSKTERMEIAAKWTELAASAMKIHPVQLQAQQDRAMRQREDKQ